MLAQEPLRYGKHFLPDFPRKILFILAVGVNAERLRDVPAQMPLLVV